MPDPAFFLCNGAPRPEAGWEDAVTLGLGGGDANINFDHEAFLRRLGTPVADRLIDLVEIAAFVYAADARIHRGGITEPKQGRFWRRDFRFRIGVRDAGFWGRTDVVEALRDLLGFLSEDDYTFDFVLAGGLAPRQGQFDLSRGSGVSADDVVMFSGGLDSLSGAVDLLALERKLALVSIETSSRAGKKQRVLARLLGERYELLPVCWTAS